MNSLGEELEALISQHAPTPEELEQRARAIARLKEACISHPWYKAQDEKHGELFWERLYSSAPLTYR